MRSKNNDIQLFKFLYSWIIVLFHLNNYALSIECPGGYYGVEFYLLSAGIFLFSSYERQLADGRLNTPGQYLWKRFSRFFIWSTTAFIFAAVVEYGLVHPVHSKWEMLDHFSSDIWEILMIKWNGMNDNTLLLNGPAWTLSSMCIVGFLIWGCLYFYNERFLKLFMPLTLIVGFGFWRHLDSAGTQVWIGFTAFGTFRTWLVMCLSFYCLQLAKKLTKLNLNKWGISLCTSAELLLHAICIVIIFNRSTRYYQWLVTLLLLVSIAIAFSGKTWMVRWTDGSKIVSFLGELSLSIYLTHIPVMELFNWQFDISGWSYREMLLLFAAIVAASLLHLTVTKWIIRIIPKIGKKVRFAVTK